MFAGRKKELAYFKKKYKAFSQKTEILKKFASDKKHIFYSAIETVDKNQLELFSKEILKRTEFEKFISTFKSWEEAFEFLANQSKDQRVLLVIDEFPYMVNGNPSIPSILQNIWAFNLKESQLMLILCGSSMAFMKRSCCQLKILCMAD